MNKGTNTRGELLVWPGVGPIANDSSSIAEFEGFVSERFGARIEFVEDLVRKDGKVDVLIRFVPDGRDGSEVIFRMFCVSVGIYPLTMISRSDYDINAVRKIFK